MGKERLRGASQSPSRRHQQVRVQNIRSEELLYAVESRFDELVQHADAVAAVQSCRSALASQARVRKGSCLVGARSEDAAAKRAGARAVTHESRGVLVGAPPLHVAAPRPPVFQAPAERRTVTLTMGGEPAAPGLETLGYVVLAQRLRHKSFQTHTRNIS